MDQTPHWYGDVSGAFGSRPKRPRKVSHRKRFSLIVEFPPAEWLISEDEDPEPIKQGDLDSWEGLDLIDEV